MREIEVLANNLILLDKKCDELGNKHEDYEWGRLEQSLMLVNNIIRDLSKEFLKEGR